MSRAQANSKYHAARANASADGDKAKHDRLSLFGRANDQFHKVAQYFAQAVGAPVTFLLALVLVVLWAVLGPVFGFSDTWQLVINTSTTIVTFLIVFLIQNTQNRDAKAMQLKLDELVRAVPKARTGLVDLEDLSEDELHRLQREFEKMRRAKEN